MHRNGKMKIWGIVLSVLILALFAIPANASAASGEAIPWLPDNVTMEVDENTPSPALFAPMSNDLTVSLNIDTIVSQLPANITVYVTGIPEGGTAYAEVFGIHQDVESGQAKFELNAGDVPEVYSDTTYYVNIYIDGEVVGSAVLTVVPNYEGIWEVDIKASKDGVVLTFPKKISPSTRVPYEVTVNGAPSAFIEQISDYELKIENLLTVGGNTIVVRNVKYPELFPSYRFGFTLTYDLGNTGVRVNFPGIEDVTLQSYTTFWKTEAGTFTDSGEISLDPGVYVIRAMKGGMTYTFSGVEVEYGELKVLDVPVKTINVFGIASACDLGVAQTDWVYRYAPATVGGSNYYKVFGNDGTYKITLKKAGFYTVTVDAVSAPAGSAWDLQAYFGPSYLYQITVPEGVTNVWISSNDWAVRGANAGDKFALLKDPSNIRDAKMRFVYGGVTYNMDFKLDGSNPFDGLFIMNFPGVEGVTLQYYKGGVWKNVDGTFDNYGMFNAPGATSVRAAKGGMTYQADGLSGATYPYVIDVPVGTITVTGIGFDCNLSIVGSNWVYQTVPCGAGEKTFQVFGGRSYELQIAKAGFNSVKIPGLAYDATIDVSEYFYATTVPDGVSSVRMQSRNWIVNPANAGDTINLLKTGDAANVKFVAGGITYNVDFVLDGDMYAPWWVEISAEPTCSGEGYTADWNILSGWKGNYAYTPALGHLYDAPAWDGYGWYIVCERCGWAGYVSYTYEDYAAISDAEFLQGIAADVLTNGLNSDNLVLNGKTLKLVFDDREIILSANANNKNVSGQVDLGDYILVFDIKGNGSNVKKFEIIAK